MANPKTGSWTYKNTGNSTAYTMYWQLTLTEGDIDYVNNQSKVYYYFGIKNGTTATSWRAMILASK